MRAGRLRHRIAIRRKPVAAGQDSFGEPTYTPEVYDTLWASVEPLSGRELLEAQQMAGEVSIRIRIRYRSGITPGMQVLFDDRELDIEAAIHTEERKRELLLLCREVIHA